MKRILMMQYCPQKCETYFLLGGGAAEYAAAHPVKLLEKWCLDNGATMAGRMQSFRHLTHSVQKPAVLISERSQLIYFPLSGIKDPACIWMCYNDVLSWHCSGVNTEVCFFDGTSVNVPFGYRVVNGQMKRCGKFLDMINSADRFPALQI